jgi:hypothetical protein
MHCLGVKGDYKVRIHPAFAPFCWGMFFLPNAASGASPRSGGVVEWFEDTPGPCHGHGIQHFIDQTLLIVE